LPSFLIILETARPTLSSSYQLAPVAVLGSFGQFWDTEDLTV
jgi:hypothetical protein